LSAYADSLSNFDEGDFGTDAERCANNFYSTSPLLAMIRDIPDLLDWDWEQKREKYHVRRKAGNVVLPTLH
jgi:hypothetical protein